MYRHQSGKTKLSGVATFERQPCVRTFLAPISEKARWNDNPPPEMAVFSASDYDRQGDHQSGLYGFVFHSNCWTLLEKVFGPQPVPRERLFDVLCAVPYSLDGVSLSWGHGFHVNMIVKGNCDQVTYPWESKITAEPLLWTHYNVTSDFLCGKESKMLLALPAVEPPGTPIYPKQSALATPWSFYPSRYVAKLHRCYPQMISSVFDRPLLLS